MKDFNAIEKMYEEYYPRIYNYIYYRTLNREITEDVVSDTFLKIMYKLKVYTPERGAFSTWIYTIARHCLSDYYRKNRACENLEDYSDVLKAGTADFERVENENDRRLAAALACLNEREREIFYWKYYLELSNRQIAEKTGLSPSNVSTIINRAHQKIKEVAGNGAQ